MEARCRSKDRIKIGRLGTVFPRQKIEYRGPKCTHYAEVLFEGPFATRGAVLATQSTAANHHGLHQKKCSKPVYLRDQAAQSRFSGDQLHVPE